MTKALLVYTDFNTSKSIILGSGTLYYLDNITSKFKDSFELKKHPSYKEKIESNFENNNGKIQMFSIRDTSSKVEIPVFYDDDNSVQLRDNYYENNMSEVEKSRKLLYNSKNKNFIKGFLKNPILLKTINYSIKLSDNEYKYALKNNIPCQYESTGFYVKTLDLFKYVSSNSKIGLMRNVFDYSLDLWKDRMISKDDFELYFYSRNLKILNNVYTLSLKNKNEIKNLSVNYGNMISLVRENNEKSTARESFQYEKIKRMI